LSNPSALIENKSEGKSLKKEHGYMKNEGETRNCKSSKGFRKEKVGSFSKNIDQQRPSSTLTSLKDINQYSTAKTSYTGSRPNSNKPRYKVKSLHQMNHHKTADSPSKTRSVKQSDLKS